ncbi:MAG: alanine racemase [Candidatus Omnitrophota bacterium]
MKPSSSAWVEIDCGNIRHNFDAVCRAAGRQLAPRAGRKVDVLAVVKADAYGHGMIEAARVIAAAGGKFFAVSNAAEGAALRQSGCKGGIVFFEATLRTDIPVLLKNNLVPAVCTMDFAAALDRAARRRAPGRQVAVQVKVDTGMGRLGVWHEDAPAFIRELARLKNIRVEGIFTHFPMADTDAAFTSRQMEHLDVLVAVMGREGISFRYLHAANSAGLGAYKNRSFNFTRPGIMLYGIYPAPELARMIRLRPVMAAKARVLMVKVIASGRGVSYGHTFRALKDTPVAVVSIGYSDGYARAFSNKAHLLINGRPCPILGRVTMDQTIVDISSALSAGVVNAGDEVVVLGQQGKLSISADDLAAWAGTIPYEIVCSLGNRLPRIYSR